MTDCFLLGGLVDLGESVEVGLNREIKEHIKILLTRSWGLVSLFVYIYIFERYFTFKLQYFIGIIKSCIEYKLVENQWFRKIFTDDLDSDPDQADLVVRK